MSGCHLGKPGPGVGYWLPRESRVFWCGEPVDNLAQRYGPSEKVALPELAAQALELGELRRVLIPSASVRLPMLWARRMIAAVNAHSFSLLAIPPTTNTLSIFSTSIGILRSCASEEYPVPKSSMASSTPSAFSLCSPPDHGVLIVHQGGLGHLKGESLRR